MSQTDEEFIQYLDRTLIPDLHQSGLTATAQDFERCVEMIRERDEQIRRCKCQGPI